MGRRAAARQGSWIKDRYLRVAVAAACVPCVLTAVLIGREYAVRGRLQAEEVRQSATKVQGEALAAQAAAIGSRLDRAGGAVTSLRDMAQLVLRSPQVFGVSQGYTAPVATRQSPPGTTTAPASSPQAPGKAPLDNPVVYAKGKGGAIRKAFDDGGSAVFYNARELEADFSAYERQRLYATAALDPLLKGAARSDDLCAQAFLLTADGLLRTYPFRDFNAMEGDRDLRQVPLYAWSKDKADSKGLVWTSPYASLLSGEWVVACLSSVQIGGKQVAVAGLEVSLAKLAKGVLSFSLGESASAWLQRVDGTVLALPAGGEESLGVTALGSAPFPSDDLPANKIIEQANVSVSGMEEIAAALGKENLATLTSVTLGQEEEGRLLYSAPVGVASWTLVSIVENPLIASLHTYERKLASATQRRLVIMLLILVVAVVLGLLLASVEAAKITRPLRVLAMQVRGAASSRSRASVLITDDSEIGDLAAAIQELVDSSSGSVLGGAAAVPQAESTEPTQHEIGSQEG